MNINITFDSSVNAAPTAFKAAVTYVVKYLDSLFTNNVTVNIDVGWGEIDGAPIGEGDLGESQEASAPYYSYGTLRSAMNNTAESSKNSLEVAANATLPTSDPTNGGNFFIGSAEAKALGLAPDQATAIDGWVGFNSSADWSYATGTVPAANAYDLAGTIEHELTEVMGRDSGIGQRPSSFSAMDLFRYSAPNLRNLNAGGSGSTAYFSVDNGVTDLGTWNNEVANGDLGDWYPQGPGSGGNDAFNDYSNPGVVNGVSATDISVMNVLGWDRSLAIVARHDFNGDGTSDQLWQYNATGGVYDLTMNNGQVAGANLVETMPTADWTFLGTGDFNGDGTSDQLWQYRATGGVYDLTMNNGQVVAANPIATMSTTDWTFLGTGDFNGDGTSDQLWQYNATGGAYDLTMNNGRVAGANLVGTMPTTNWTFLATGDFNGDGTSDQLWQYNGTGGVYDLAMDNGQVAAANLVETMPTTDWTFLATGDFNGDGMSDQLWQDKATSGVYDLTMNNGQVTAANLIETMPSPDWTFLGTGDFNIDGTSDMLWQVKPGGGIYDLGIFSAQVGASLQVATLVTAAWSHLA